MKQKIEIIIKENEDLRKILLAQDGGIMKFWAEHPDYNGAAALFRGYQNQCVDKFYEKNKWDTNKVWEGEGLRRTALGQTEHLMSELCYQRVLMTQLSNMSADVVVAIEVFTEQYLTYAYKQDRKRRYPNVSTDMDIYREVIGMYTTIGLAYKCMELILNEHHANEKIEKTELELFTEFLIRQSSNHLTLGIFLHLRKAVAEMVKGKTDEQCRQMAIETMKKLRVFSQMIYTDEVVDHLRKTKYIEKAEQREKDGKWLRHVANHITFEELSAQVKTHSMRFYFADYVYVLKDVGRIWAAQLLVHGIDMRKLEKEVGCILNPNKDLHYYVDKNFIEDMPVDCCVYDEDKAKELLDKINISGKKSDEQEPNGKNKKGKRKKNFKTFIIDKKKTNKVLNIIRNNIDKDSAKQTALVIIGGIEAGMIQIDVTAPSIESEFGVNGNSIKPHLTKYRNYKNGVTKSYKENPQPYKELFLK